VSFATYTFKYTCLRNHVSILTGPLLNTILLRDMFLLKQQRVTLQAFFNSFDDEGDGYLAHNEFAVMVASLDMEMDNEQLRAVIKSIDTDGGGFIDYPEFEGAMQRHQQVQ
jgi:Ca2+-binding EF-hand superfamily protein